MTEPLKVSLAAFDFGGVVKLFQFDPAHAEYKDNVREAGEDGAKLLGRIELEFHPEKDSFSTASFPPGELLVSVAHELARRLADGDLLAESVAIPAEKRVN